jgi:tripartite-type tricarboxylate transporter receptor subunit TctC
MPRIVAAVIAALAMAASAPAFRDAVASDLYQGKTIRLVVASDVGGGYDSYARTFAHYVRRHIPGEPTVVVQNMPGAGGITSANWLYAVAPKDGLTILLHQRGIPFHPYFGEKGAKFVPTEFQWLGSFNSETGITSMWHTAKVKTMANAFKETAVLGGSGPNDSETYPFLMNNTIGTKFRIVSGYKSNSHTMLAVERGEVDGISGSWSSLKAGRPQWLRDKQVNLIVQVARTKHPDLPNVPLIYEYVKEPEHRVMWDVMTAIATLGRPLAAPPGVPTEQVAILRKAFAATMKDPEYLAEMEKSNRELTPTRGEEMQQMMQEVSVVPQATLAKLNSWIRRQ